MKKLLGILVLGLLFSLVTSQAISAGCKIPKKPKEKIIEAPEAVLKKHKILSNKSLDTQTTTITKYRAIAKNKKDNLVEIKSRQLYYDASFAKEDVIKRCKLFFEPHGEEMQNACYVDKVIEDKEKITISKNRIKKVLANRRTINVFRAWNDDYGTKKYGLYFTKTPRMPGPSNLALREIYWNYHYLNKPQWKYLGLEPFISKKKMDIKRS